MYKYPQHINELENADFFILDKRDKRSIAIIFKEENSFEGISFHKDNLGWELNPIKIHNGFISAQIDRYNFTKEFEAAKQFSDRTI